MDIRDSSEISEEYIPTIIEQFKANYVTKIQLLGGEPLLAKGLIPVLYECFENQIAVEITTNGVSLTKEIATAICLYDVDAVTFSIDGFASESNDFIRGVGSYNKVISGLYQLSNIIEEKRSKTQIYVNTVIGKASLHEALDVIQFLSKNTCISGISISMPDIVGNASKQDEMTWPTYTEFIDFVLGIIIIALNNDKKELLNKIDFGVPPRVKAVLNSKFNLNMPYKSYEYCMGGSSVFTLDATGVLYPCNLTHGIEWFNKKYSFRYLFEHNNILSKSFDEIYTSKNYLDFFQFVRANDLKSKEYTNIKICSNCEVSQYCHTNCPLDNYVATSPKICEAALQHSFLENT